METSQNSSRELLVHWFKAHPLSPLEDEAILVQSNGIGQWLKLALAANATDEIGGGCGIAASLDMLFALAICLASVPLRTGSCGGSRSISIR